LCVIVIKIKTQCTSASPIIIYFLFPLDFGVKHDLNFILTEFEKKKNQNYFSPLCLCVWAASTTVHVENAFVNV